MTEPDAVAEGRAAWRRLRSRASFGDWVAVGRALLHGRAVAMAEAKTNRPVGTAFNRAMGAWLDANGFREISAQERGRAVELASNLPAVSAWISSLPAAKARRMNHPHGVLMSWRAATGRKAASPADKVRQWRQARESFANLAPEGIMSDHVRAAADAMRQSGSRDWYTLARRALEAARAVDRAGPINGKRRDEHVEALQ